MSRLMFLLLFMNVLSGCSLKNQSVAAEPPIIEESVHQQILNATVQIKLVAPMTDAAGEQVVAERDGIWHRQNAVVNGLGTLIKIDNEMMIVTHDHWGDSLFKAEIVEFRNADGVLIAELLGIFFRNLIRYRDEGTLLMQAPQELAIFFDYAVEQGDATALNVGKRVFFTRHQLGNQRVEVVGAQVTAVSDVTPIPTIDLLSLDGSPVNKGDSGGGIWADGKLVGNMWWTVLEETSSERQNTDASGAARLTDSIQASLAPPQADVLSGGGARQLP